MKLRNALVLLLGAICMAAQAPPPPSGPPPPPGGSAGVRRHLDQVAPVDELSRKVLGLAKVYLEKSETAQKRTPFARGRYLAAADALLHAAEHQQHSVQKNGPEPPDQAEISDHLDRVYFRLQQADYFVKQSADPNAKNIAAYTRQYYQQALRASAGGDPRSADECAKSAEDLMRALENLAQSTVPDPTPPPPPPHPGPEDP